MSLGLGWSVRLKLAVAQQPIGIGVDGGELPFQTYTGGILDSPTCLKSPNHAITIVGYGVHDTDNLEYWIVRNPGTHDKYELNKLNDRIQYFTLKI